MAGGLFALFLGILAMLFPLLQHAEKPGVLVLYGHNFDVRWEIGLPLLLLGLLLLVVDSRKRKRISWYHRNVSTFRKTSRPGRSSRSRA